MEFLTKNFFMNGILNTSKKTAADAANHFKELYADELKAGEVTNDAIYEWWIQTRDQYPDEIDYEEVEKLINN
jgi:hypothetical protein